MGDIAKEIAIDAPVSKVYRYVVDPHNAPRYISSIKRIVSGPEGAPTKGDVWRAEANFFGQNHLLNLRLDALSTDKGVRFVLEGDLQATLALRLSSSSKASGTRVSLSLDAPSVPSFLLNALLGGLLAEDLTRLRRNLESAT